MTKHIRSVLCDPDRLETIHRLGMTTMESDPKLKGYAEQAAQRVNLPICLITAVLDDAQIFVAHRGLRGWAAEVEGTPVEWSFCQYAVAGGETFVVEDARVHEDVRASPLVQNDGIRCYAGVPLVSGSGHAVGTLCVLGGEPRRFSEEELRDLERMAREVMTHIEEVPVGGRTRGHPEDG